MASHYEEHGFCHCIWHTVTVNLSSLSGLDIRTHRTNASLGTEEKGKDGRKHFLTDETTYYCVSNVLRREEAGNDERQNFLIPCPLSHRASRLLILSGHHHMKNSCRLNVEKLCPVSLGNSKHPTELLLKPLEETMAAYSNRSLKFI